MLRGGYSVINLKKLLKFINLKVKSKSFHEHNEHKASLEIIENLKEGKIVSIVSDAGTPAISDPGYKLIQRCLKENIKYTLIPGPSSVLSSLVMAINIRESTSTAKPMAKELTPGETVRCTTESGRTVRRKVMAFGVASTETVLLANGSTTRQRATVFIRGVMETVTKANGKHA